MKTPGCNKVFLVKQIMFYLLIAILLGACNSSESRKSLSEEPDSLRVLKYAERFSIDTINSNVRLTIKNPWQGAENIQHTFWLIKRGDKMPAGTDSSEVIFLPVQRIICMATSHAAMISALGEEKSICGISGGELVFDEKVESLISNGEIEEVGYDANLNKELILKLAPDIIMMYGIGSESGGYLNKMKELGLKVIYNADYLENNPLGRAEWIKVFGALYEKRELADSLYEAEVLEYTRIKRLITGISGNRPKVMMGLPFRDTWYISPGNSYMSRLIEDAGGSYLWADKESDVSMPLGIESVYVRALTADFWINIGTVKSKNELSMADKRFSELPCFLKGNLYNNNRYLKGNGANDYWEKGMLYPHLVLKDLASVFHTGLFNDELRFYTRIN
jgi:iron complex transport system substrate-binding protein